jgi:hypothetical protein
VAGKGVDGEGVRQRDWVGAEQGRKEKNQDGNPEGSGGIKGKRVQSRVGGLFTQFFSKTPCLVKNHAASYEGIC